jgi:hypothetical protein
MSFACRVAVAAHISDDELRQAKRSKGECPEMPNRSVEERASVRVPQDENNALSVSFSQHAAVIFEDKA